MTRDGIFFYKYKLINLSLYRERFCAIVGEYFIIFIFYNMKSIFNHRQAHYTSYVPHCEDFSRIFINAKDTLSDIISDISIYILYVYRESSHSQLRV